MSKPFWFSNWDETLWDGEREGGQEGRLGGGEGGEWVEKEEEKEEEKKEWGGGDSVVQKATPGWEVCDTKQSSHVTFSGVSIPTSASHARNQAKH